MGEFLTPKLWISKVIPVPYLDICMYINARINGTGTNLMVSFFSFLFLFDLLEKKLFFMYFWIGVLNSTFRNNLFASNLR